ncbi:MAG: hypothetical protein RBU30_08895 [Polyangia bacterium]|nr:hypothetical protein [Polyangia bacterium]
MSDPTATIRTWAMTALPDLTDVILANQITADAPRPDLPYAVLHLERDAATQQTPVVITTDEIPTVGSALVIQRSSYARSGTLAIELVGSGSMERGRDLQLALSDETCSTQLMDAGIALVLVADVTDDPDLRDTTWEPGASMGFRVRWVDTVERSVPYIDATKTVLTISEDPPEE